MIKRAKLFNVSLHLVPFSLGGLDDVGARSLSFLFRLVTRPYGTDMP